jgi:heat shock protein HtpX
LDVLINPPLHFINQDSWGSSHGGTGAIGTLLMVVMAPLAAMLVQMAISSTREYAADDIGARLSGNLEALASAWRKSTRP